MVGPSHVQAGKLCLKPLLNCQCCFRFWGCGLVVTCTLEEILFLELGLPLTSKKYRNKKISRDGALNIANTLTFAFMHHPYLVSILYGMPSLHLLCFYFFVKQAIVVL